MSTTSGIGQPFPLKSAGRLPCFYAAQKQSFCLHQKGENRDLPLWNPPSRNVQRESLGIGLKFKQKVRCKRVGIMIRLCLVKEGLSGQKCLKIDLNQVFLLST
ncbi:MAG: hypothetical protein A3E85_04135 [Gammaproteobacteria bacterium RIFCSPHIGHO2_12_FULL_45_12]|nr:MAG: hypothetical protein A3E85_04135 [Gammaproteobacteria bacterium RIFCSPHIGHO2_12_FULL_45_12]